LQTRKEVVMSRLRQFVSGPLTVWFIAAWSFPSLGVTYQWHPTNPPYYWHDSANWNPAGWPRANYSDSATVDTLPGVIVAEEGSAETLTVAPTTQAAVEIVGDEVTLSCYSATLGGSGTTGTLRLINGGRLLMEPQGPGALVLGPTQSSVGEVFIRGDGDICGGLLQPGVRDQDRRETRQ
jgi:hypothetical protein